MEAGGAAKVVVYREAGGTAEFGRGRLVEQQKSSVIMRANHPVIRLSMLWLGFVVLLSSLSIGVT